MYIIDILRMENEFSKYIQNENITELEDFNSLSISGVGIFWYSHVNNFVVGNSIRILTTTINVDNEDLIWMYRKQVNYYEGESISLELFEETCFDNQALWMFCLWRHILSKFIITVHSLMLSNQVECLLRVRIISITV